MKSWPRPEPVEQLGPNVRIPGLAWGTNVGDRTLGQGLGQGLAMAMARPGQAMAMARPWPIFGQDGQNLVWKKTFVQLCGNPS